MEHATNGYTGRNVCQLPYHQKVRSVRHMRRHIDHVARCAMTEFVIARHNTRYSVLYSAVDSQIQVDFTVAGGKQRTEAQCSQNGTHKATKWHALQYKTANHAVYVN